MTTDAPAFAFPANVLHREVDGQLVLLDLEQEEYFGLDEIGADIVRGLTSTSIEATVSQLLADYDVAPDALRADLDALVGSLLEAGLLAPVRDAP